MKVCPRLKPHAHAAGLRASVLFRVVYVQQWWCTNTVARCTYIRTYVLFLVAHGSVAGEWVSCDQVLLGFELCQGSYQWEDKPNFTINHCSTGNVTVSLGITIKGVSQYYVYINACQPRCDMLLLTHALVHSFQFLTYVCRLSFSKQRLHQLSTLFTASVTPLASDSQRPDGTLCVCSI